MRIFKCCLTALFLLMAGLLSSAVHAQQATVLLSASPSVIFADGRSTTTITATASANGAGSVPDGTPIRFSTTAGVLNSETVNTAGGVARVTLTSSPVAGSAVITATFVSSTGGGTGQLQVEFTSDKDLANTNQGDADWLRIYTTEYLAYSADSKMIDASAKKQGVRLEFRGLVINADALQADLDSGVIRARNAELRRGKNTEEVELLTYNIFQRTGQAMLTQETGGRTVQFVQVDGAALKAQPLKRTAVQPAAFDFEDISDSRVLITASSVAVRINDRIQLKHATIYMDDKKIVSMPLHVMPLTTDEAFGQQIVGYGTDGFYLDVPYYSSLTQQTTSAFYLRSPTASQEAGTYYSGRSGLALDYDSKFNATNGNSVGEFQVVGLSRQDWGARWNETQRFSNTLKGYFYVDAPNHNSIFASSNLTQQFKGFSVNMTTTENHGASVDNTSEEQRDVTSYIQTTARTLIGTHAQSLQYSTGVSLQSDSLWTHNNGATYGHTVSTKSLNLDLFTSPFSLSKQSHLTDSVLLSDAYSSDILGSALTARAVVNVNTRFSQMASSTLTYTFAHNPYVGTPLPSSYLPASYFDPNQHNFGLSLNYAPRNNRWSTSFQSSYTYPTGDTTYNTSLTFFPSNAWRFGIAQYYSLLEGYTYQDLEFTLSRRIGPRELQIYWSAAEHRIRVNLNAAEF